MAKLIKILFKMSFLTGKKKIIAPPLLQPVELSMGYPKFFHRYPWRVQFHTFSSSLREKLKLSQGWLNVWSAIAVVSFFWIKYTTIFCPKKGFTTTCYLPKDIEIRTFNILFSQIPSFFFSSSSFPSQIPWNVTFLWSGFPILTT